MKGHNSQHDLSSESKVGPHQFFPGSKEPISVQRADRTVKEEIMNEHTRK